MRETTHNARGALGVFRGVCVKKTRKVRGRRVFWNAAVALSSRSLLVSPLSINVMMQKVAPFASLHL